MKLEELRIYQFATHSRKEVHKEVGEIPNQWSIPDVDQLLRSSSSVSANIAEGFSRGFYPKDYLRFLVYALGSSDETKNHIHTLAEDK